jgi:hypothetical protein
LDHLHQLARADVAPPLPNHPSTPAVDHQINPQAAKIASPETLEHYVKTMLRLVDDGDPSRMSTRELAVVTAVLKDMRDNGHYLRVPDTMPSLQIAMEQAFPARRVGVGEESREISVQQIPLGRLLYENDLKAIPAEAKRRQEAGQSVEDSARWAYNRRNELTEQYRERMPQDMRAVIESGENKPRSFEDLVARNKGDYAAIVASAGRPSALPIPWDAALDYLEKQRAGDPGAKVALDKFASEYAAVIDAAKKK